MKFLVENCFHWAGFHLVDLLLENGHTVIGLDQLDTNKKDNLAMFVERNSLFTLNDKLNEKVDISIKVTETKGDIILTLLTTQIKYKIQLSCLFGEWMSKSKINHLIAIKESNNVNDMLYVRNAMAVVLHWFEKAVLLPTTINICPQSSDLAKKELKKNVILRENGSIDEYIEKTLDHYQINYNLY